MTVSSRTPEGLPFRCSICGKMAAMEISLPGGDATCPSCGQLLWWFRDRLGDSLAAKLGIRPEELGNTDFAQSYLRDLGIDSLDLVELVMELEEEFGVTIPDEQADKIKSIEDIIRYIQEHRNDPNE